ncbi:MAG: UDP-2,3-diacylglucosamine diphosphatase [Pirellulales bacterium]|nr:UDP-2,3-diacylglucosamine diphosphatase [Pirellulales bacterium]
MRSFETVVVSDLHLGARNSRAAEFIDFLGRVAISRLIVAGDLFQCPRLSRPLGEADAEVLSILRRLADAGDAVWIRGNHDPHADFAWAVLGLPQCDEVNLAVGEKNYLVTHGDRWDRAMELPKLIVDGADAIYRGVQMLDRSHALARMLKRGSKHFCRVVQRLRNRAIDESEQRGYDGVILGHTHVAEEYSERGIHYLNSGCWTERPATYVGVQAGRARLYRWNHVERTPEPQPATFWSSDELVATA